jgi:SAM-dependent methyltransferase
MGEKHFDRAAAGWDQKQRRIEMAARIAGAISSALPLAPTMKAMEYGCGTGLVGLALAPQLASLIAVDTSSGMLEILARKIADEKIPNVTPFRLDLPAEPYTDRFDLIFSAMVLHHVRETDKILARLVDLLVVGGYLALADLWEEDGSFHDPGMEGVMHHGFNPADLAARLGGLGMGEVTWTEVHSIIKSDGAGTERAYPVFLLTGRKE